MGYLHISNLYKDQTILMFKECYALLKLHGTSANISMNGDGELKFFPGGVNYESFVKLFYQDKLRDLLEGTPCTIYGEAYGGSCQKMSATYGPNLKFCAFDVMIGDVFLSVPQAAEFVANLDLEFVDYVRIPTTLEAIDAERDKDDTQAIRNGMGPGKKREGVVLRPLIELRKNNGERIICKHKRDDFSEVATPRPVSAEKLIVIEEAKAIALEWVTPMRLQHVIDKIEQADITKMRDIIKAMLEDIKREAEGEIIWSKEAEGEISKRTAQLAKAHFQTIIIE